MMRNTGRYFLISICLTSCITYASVTTPEQKEIVDFIQKMYSYSANMFEGREFGGKDDPLKHCTLLRNFFVQSLLKIGRFSNDRVCDFGVYIRYPGLSGDSFDIYGDLGAIQRPTFSTPVVDGVRASVAATTKEFGKTVYFLVKTQSGWRVENALYYEDWPLAVDAKCMSKFLVKPDDWHRKAEQPVCRP